MNEEELTKKDIDDYDKRRQKEYDEATKGNEEIRKKQEEEKKKKGLLDEGSAFRTTAAIGTEVGLNTLLDLFSFVPPAQVAGGSAINYFAQKIRGGEISKGEMIASGLASLIPGAAQARSLSGVIGKTPLRGGVSGALETGAADLIDTGKVDVVNVVAGGAIGTTFGGLFGTAIGMKPTQVGNAITRMKAKLRGGDFLPRDSDIVEGVGTVGAAKRRIDATDLPDADDTAAMTRYYDQEAAINKALSQEQTVSRKNVKNNLDLYGADPDIFEDYNNLRDAMNMPDVRGGRFVKVDNKYYTVFTRGNKQQVLPYNKWYSRNVNPFMVPKQLLKKLKKFEEGQQGDLLKVSEKNPAGVPTIKVPYGTKGKFREVVPPTKYAKGTVDEFNNWYKDIFKLQKEEQALNRQVSEMLEKLGNIEARNPGKKVFDTDLSHIAPRSKGGSGLTFQEAWILNQQRGADDILDDNILAAAGIPKNWEELFYLWLAQKKPGRELQTAIGNLAQINVDDYFALSKGEALNVVGKRRKDIRNMVNRQIGNKETYRLAGKRGTIQDDFEAAVRASKAGQVGGDIFLNDRLLDIRWVAKNFNDLLEIGDI